MTTGDGDDDVDGDEVERASSTLGKRSANENGSRKIFQKPKKRSCRMQLRPRGPTPAAAAAHDDGGDDGDELEEVDRVKRAENAYGNQLLILAAPLKDFLLLRRRQRRGR